MAPFIKQFRTKASYFFRPAHLGVYILLAAVVWSYGYYKTRLISTRGSISVTGVAYQDVSADQAKWAIQIERTHKDRKTSYDLTLTDEQKVRTFLKNHDAPQTGPSSYDTRPVYSKAESDRYGSDTNEIEGYRSTALFGITTGEVNKIDEISGKMHQFLIDEDITLTRNEVEYNYTKLEELKISLLEKAIANARERASAIGKNAGTTIGGIISANQGIFQINRSGDTSVSDYGNYDTSSIAKTVRALVTVELEAR